MQTTVHTDNQASVSGSPQRDGSYVDWPCAIAGAFVASAVSFVLLAFGSGIGLSMVSPWDSQASSLSSLGIFAPLWVILVQLAAFGVGGYLAGRMRRPWRDTVASEVEFRDGAHGALVWAVAVVVSAMLLASAVMGVARTTAEVAGAAASAAASTGTLAAISGNGASELFRTTTVPAAGAPATDEGNRADAARFLLNSVSPSGLRDTDRAYLVQLVASRTGITAAEAEQRVAQVLNDAKVAADRVRRLSIIAAFLTAATLLAGAAIAWSSARIGGRHRDQNVIWRGLARQQRPFGTARPFANT